jgi:hypothetical protein
LVYLKKNGYKGFSSKVSEKAAVEAASEAVATE